MKTIRKILSDNMVLQVTKWEIQSRNILVFPLHSFTKQINKWLFEIQKFFFILL